MVDEIGQQLPATRNLHESLSRAEEWAARRKHTVVGLDHLLLALGQDPDAVSILLACNVNVEALCMDLLRKLGPEARMLTPNAVPPTFDITVQNLLAHATAAAIEVGQTEIDGANILSAIISGEGGMITHKILERHGLTFEQALQTLNSLQEQQKAKNQPKKASKNPNPVVNAKKAALEKTEKTPVHQDAETKLQTENLHNTPQNEKPAAAPDIYKDTIIQAEAHPSDYGLSAEENQERSTPPPENANLTVPQNAQAPHAAPPPQAAMKQQKAPLKTQQEANKQLHKPQKKDEPSSRGPAKVSALKTEIESQIKSENKSSGQPQKMTTPPPPPGEGGANLSRQDELGHKDLPPSGNLSPLPERQTTGSQNKQLVSQGQQQLKEHGQQPGGMRSVGTRDGENFSPPPPTANPQALHKTGAPPFGSLHGKQGNPQNTPPPSHQPPPPHVPRGKAGHEQQRPPLSPDQQITMQELGTTINRVGQNLKDIPPENQVIENIPKVMRVGKMHYVEVRVARFANTEIDFGPDHYGLRAKHDKIPITKAITVRLTGPDGQFLIDSATASTQWTEIHNGVVDEADFAVWRWRVMPRRAGASKFRLDITARTSSEEGITAEIPVQPSRSIDVKVTRNFGTIIKRLLALLLVFAIGYGIAEYGEQLLTRAQTEINKLTAEEE